MKGDMMIEFNGYLTGVSQKFFCKRIVRLQQTWACSAVIIACILIPVIMQKMFGDVDIIGNLRLIIITYVAAIAAVLLLPNIQTKKEKEKSLLKKCLLKMILS